MALRTALTLLVVALTSLVSPASRAETSLHQQIDQLIETASLGTVAEVATDGEFLRRVYLDLTGSIPPSDVAREFRLGRKARLHERGAGGRKSPGNRSSARDPS